MESLSRGQKALRIAGYVAFFIFALLIGIRLTLPTGQASDLIKSKLTESLGAERVDIGDLSLRGLFPSGVEIEDFSIVLPPIPMKTAERGGFTESPSRTFLVEEFIANGSLLGAAKQNFDFEFEGKIQSGLIEGGVFQHSPDGPFKLKIEKLEKIALGSEALFLSLTGFDIIGDLGGNIDITIPRQEGERGRLQMEQISGEITLTLSEALIAQPIIDTTMNREQMRLAFTDIDLGNVLMRIKTEAPNTETKGPRRGVLIVDELSMTGGDLEVISAPRGMITIPSGGSLRDATINLHLVLRIADGWFDREIPDPKDPTKMTKPNTGLRTMMTMGPLKNVMLDGQFGITLTGSLMKPNINPQRPRTRLEGAAPTGASNTSRSPSTGSSRRVNVNQGNNGAGMGDGDAEANPAPVERASRPTRTSTERAMPVVPAAPVGGEDDSEDDIAPEVNPSLNPQEGSAASSRQQQMVRRDAATSPSGLRSVRPLNMDRGNSERMPSGLGSGRNASFNGGIRSSIQERARPSLGVGQRQNLAADDEE